jgi:hypothetical protein
VGDVGVDRLADELIEGAVGFVVAAVDGAGSAVLAADL